MLEVLIALLILAVTFTASMGVVFRALRISQRAEETTEAVLKTDKVLFELESGLRADLAKYGGREILDENYQFETTAKGREVFFQDHKIRILKHGVPILTKDVVLREASLS